MENKPILLIAFYNTKALGVRFLEKSLVRAGFKVYTLFVKDFNSIEPEAVTDSELMLLKGLVSDLNPGFIGLSVMSSLYLESVMAVNAMLRKEFSIPIVWGGVYASLFPEKSLENADFVMRGECEEAIIELAGALLNNKPYQKIKNLAYKSSAGPAFINALRPLCKNLDELGYPIFNQYNKFLIDKDRLERGDPMFGTVSYELSSSRGCPFTCSYCSSINLKRMYGGNGNYVRFRSVSSVIGELSEAMANLKNLKSVHFWDEIFPDDIEWISDFAFQYKARIRLPFEIWGHPLKTNAVVISRLAGAGLYKVVMGIQSGSPAIRKEIFHRAETQDEILEAGSVLSSLKVPQVIYDFMLRHPFEKEEDIKQTYELCTRLSRPFELQLHGLNFLPGTDIVKIAARKGMVGIGDIAAVNASLKENYKAYWGNENSDKKINFWYSMIYLSQFRVGLLLSALFYKAPKTEFIMHMAILLSKLFRPAAKIRHYRKKAALLVRAILAKVSLPKQSKREIQYIGGN